VLDLPMTRYENPAPRRWPVDDMVQQIVNEHPITSP
jgi:hypothetical protein